MVPAGWFWIESTYIQVQNLGSQNVIIHNLDIKSSNILGNGLELLCKLGSADTICTINNQLALYLSSPQSTNKRLRQLLIVSSLGGLAVCLGSPLRIDTAREVMKLRGSKDLVVGVFDVGGIQACSKSSNQAVARGTGVAAVDNASGVVEINLELSSQGLEGVEELLVCSAIDKTGRMGLPVLLKHLAHGVDNLDTIVGSRVVAGRDHDADGLAVELAATKTSQQTDTEADAGQQVSFHAKASRAIRVGVAGDDGVFGRSLEDLCVHCESSSQLGSSGCRLVNTEDGRQGKRRRGWLVEVWSGTTLQRRESFKCSSWRGGVRLGTNRTGRGSLPRSLHNGLLPCCRRKGEGLV